MAEKKKITLKEIGTDKLILIGICGIALVVLSFPSKNSSESKKNEDVNIVSQTVTNDFCETNEERLRSIIEKIDGVESAEVMITLKASSEKIVLKDNPYEQEKSKEEERYVYSDASVIVEDSDGNMSPYVVKELEPKIEGIAVIYKGKNDGEIPYKITSVIMALFEIESHKISVVEQ